MCRTGNSLERVSVANIEYCLVLWEWLTTARLQQEYSVWFQVPSQVEEVRVLMEPIPNELGNQPFHFSGCGLTHGMSWLMYFIWAAGKMTRWLSLVIPLWVSAMPLQGVDRLHCSQNYTMVVGSRRQQSKTLTLAEVYVHIKPLAEYGLFLMEIFSIRIEYYDDIIMTDITTALLEKYLQCEWSYGVWLKCSSGAYLWSPRKLN